jgi:hypothetical protein
MDFSLKTRRGGPPDVETGRQLGSQVGAVYRVGRPTVCGQSPLVTGAPPAVEAVDKVGHHDVAMEMRVEVSIHSVSECGRDESGRWHKVPIYS